MKEITCLRVCESNCASWVARTVPWWPAKSTYSGRRGQCPEGAQWKPSFRKRLRQLLGYIVYNESISSAEYRGYSTIGGSEIISNMEF